MMIALCSPVIPNRPLGKKIFLVTFLSALVGICFPSIGFYLLVGELVAIIVAFFVSFVRGLLNVRW